MSEVATGSASISGAVEPGTEVDQQAQQLSEDDQGLKEFLDLEYQEAMDPNGTQTAQQPPEPAPVTQQPDVTELPSGEQPSPPTEQQAQQPQAVQQPNPNAQPSSQQQSGEQPLPDGQQPPAGDSAQAPQSAIEQMLEQRRQQGTATPPVTPLSPAQIAQAQEAMGQPSQQPQPVVQQAPAVQQPLDQQQLIQGFQQAYQTRAVELMETYKLNDDQVEKIRENPNEVLPALLAKIQLDTIASVSQALAQAVPRVVEVELAKHNQGEQVKNQFFSFWAGNGYDLRPYENDLMSLSNMFWQNNPNASPDQHRTEVGAAVIVARQLAQGQVAQQQQVQQPQQMQQPNGQPRGSGRGHTWQSCHSTTTAAEWGIYVRRRRLKCISTTHSTERVGQCRQRTLWR